MTAVLNLIVLRCRDMHTSKQFYEALGLSFTEEQHGKGPVHFAYENGRLYTTHLEKYAF